MMFFVTVSAHTSMHQSPPASPTPRHNNGPPRDTHGSTNMYIPAEHKSRDPRRDKGRPPPKVNSSGLSPTRIGTQFPYSSLTVPLPILNILDGLFYIWQSNRLHPYLVPSVLYIFPIRYIHLRDVSSSSNVT